MAQMETLIEDWVMPALDGSKWISYHNYDILPNGILQLRAGLSNNQATIIQSRGVYDFSQSQAIAKVTRVINASDNGYCGMSVLNDSGSNYYAITFDSGRLFFQAKGSDGKTVTLNAVPYDPNVHVWWKIKGDSVGGRVTFQTSSDGYSWITQARATRPPRLAMADMRLQFSNGFYTANQPNVGVMQVQLVNTSQKINRGGPLGNRGYGYEDMATFPAGNVPVEKNYGVLSVVDDGGDPSNAQIVRSTKNVMRLKSGRPDQFIVMRTNLRNKLRNIDATFKTRMTSKVDRADLNTGQRLIWRVADIYSTRYEIEVREEYMLVARFVSNKRTQLLYIPVGTDFNILYTWRICHVGSQCIIYRDMGDFASTGTVTPVSEIGRFSDDAIKSGHIGIYASGSTIDVSLLQVSDGLPQPPEPLGLPVRKRNWGVFTADNGANDNLSYNPPPATVTPMPSMVYEPAQLERLEAKVGKYFNLASWFLDDNAEFPEGARVFAEQGRHNLISFGPERVDASAILAGAMDTYLTSLARAIAALPTKSYLRLFPEMNGEWAPWSLHFDENIYNDGRDLGRSLHVKSHAQFIQMWRHIHNLFVNAGCDKSKLEWIFCVNATDEPRNDFMHLYYPGDQYVDILAYDIYNWGSGQMNWENIEETYRPGYLRMCALHPTKPIWIAETGAKETLKDDGRAGFTYVAGKAPKDPAHSKASWVTELLNSTRYPRISTFVWFNIEKERDWRMNSSPGVLSAFRTGFADITVTEPEIIDPESDPLPALPGSPDVNASWYYDYIWLEEPGQTSIRLSPSTGGIWVTSINMGFPSFRTDTFSKATLSGTRDLTKLHDEKQVSLGLVVSPYGKVPVPYLRDLLARWMRPDRRPVLRYRMKGQEERTISLVPRSMSSAIESKDRITLEAQIQFVAPDGLARSAEDKYAEVTPDTSPVEVITEGNGVAYPVIRIYGPCVNPLLINDSAEGANESARLGLNMTLKDGEFVEIDVNERTVQFFGYVGNEWSLRSFMSSRDWFGLAPYRSSIRMESADGRGSASLTWKDVWTL